MQSRPWSAKRNRLFPQTATREILIDQSLGELLHARGIWLARHGRGAHVIELRDIQFLQALARHRHFARAAKACGVSQPAFSMRIQKLEDKLGVALVRRDNRFLGLTEAGELVLRHGAPLIDGMKALEQDLNSERGRAAGVLRLGVVPTAATFAGLAAAKLAQSFPDIQMRIETASSLVIQQRLIDGTFEAGISYHDGADQDLLRLTPLYDERYMLLCPIAMAPPGAATITWTKAATLPLALLEPNMQNRAILNRVFEKLGVLPHVVAETSALTSALAMAREGFAATVVPDVVARGLAANMADTIVLELVAPEVTKSISLMSVSRGEMAPVVAALHKALAEPL